MTDKEREQLLKAAITDLENEGKDISSTNQKIEVASHEELLDQPRYTAFQTRKVLPPLTSEEINNSLEVIQESAIIPVTQHKQDTFWTSSATFKISTIIWLMLIHVIVGATLVMISQWVSKHN